jgi:hypothetical protein
MYVTNVVYLVIMDGKMIILLKYLEKILSLGVNIANHHPMSQQ